MGEVDRFSEMDSRIAAFWSWFVENEARIRSIASPDSLLVRLTGAKLKDVHPGLNFEVAVDCEPVEFVISANGAADLFSMVEHMVSCAPELAKWRFIPLRPARGFGLSSETEVSSAWNPIDFGFVPLRKQGDPGFLGLRVGVPTKIDASAEETRDRVFMMLDHGLGERRVAEMISYLEVVPMPAQPAEAGFTPLLDLSCFLDQEGR